MDREGLEDPMAKGEGEVTRVLRRVAKVMQGGKFDEALRDLLHLSEKYPDAGEIRPQIAEVYIRRGESRARRGKSVEAKADFERSLSWTRKPSALVALARGLMADGDLDQAHQLLHAALEIDDTYGPVHEALGDLYFGWGEFAESAKAFEQALGHDHATPSLYKSAWTAYLRHEKLDRAHEVILEGVERFPESDELQAAAGDSWVYVRGEPDEAQPFWERSAELNPKNFGAQFALAAHCASKGDLAASRERLRACAGLDLERTRRMFREDLGSPLKKFGDLARDAEVRRILGWEPD